MIKAILDTFVAIAIFLIGFLHKRMTRKWFIFSLVCIVMALGINGIFMYNDGKNATEEKVNLNKKIDNLSAENRKSQGTINNLVTMNNEQQEKTNELKSMVVNQSAKIDELNHRIAQLVKLLEEISVAKLEKTDSYVRAKEIYNSAMNLMNQGNQKEAAQKFLEFREIAIKEGAYEAAAISSLIASYRFEDIGEETKAAQLQSEAGDFFIKLNRFGEAKIWKNNAKELYKQQGLTTEAMSLDREIKTLELRLK
ncbi:MAG: hypothetical protein WC412_07725 [Candidatus Omnitrophota bacterium]|jgi:leucyl aminopeptidase